MDVHGDEYASPAPDEDEDHERHEHGGDDRLAHHTRNGGTHEDRLIEVEPHLEPLGATARMRGSIALAASTTANVEASAFLRIDRYAARRPSIRTMFFCSANPSRTVATSPISTGAPLTTLTGMLLKSATFDGLELMRHVVVAIADARRAGRDQQVGRQERTDHILGRQSLARQRLRVHIDGDLAQLAAIWRRRREPGDGEELETDEVLPVVGDVLLGHGLRRQRHCATGTLDAFDWTT